MLEHPHAYHLGEQGVATHLVGHGELPKGWHAGHMHIASASVHVTELALRSQLSHIAQALPLLHEPNVASWDSDLAERDVPLAQGVVPSCALQ